MDDKVVYEISKINIEDENFVEKVNDILKKNNINVYENTM